MTSPTGASRPARVLAASATAVLAILAFLPALASSPGRMPADSKLYLYLDPGRFLSTAAGSFDPGQFVGWVPHQHIAYLWPSGPFYWVFDQLGLPDWVAHRLWIGSLFFAAGTGIWWCARRLGLGAAAALAAAVVYQTSVYVLPYVSRTSVMLLPWAGLGWILGLTVRATLQPSDNRWGRWREPALIALIVATVGAVNATALIMVAPLPVLWLATSLRSTGWRWTAGFAARTAVLSCGVSVWWAAMLVIQGRYGAPVLPYSETLADVSYTSTASEVWRGLGYWLFYIRDVRGPTTTASLPYLISGRTILVSYAVPIVGLVGLATTSWRHARFAALSIGIGGVLAVGVHPIWDRSPLMSLAGDGGLALALRSSTRALPVMMVGVALGCGALTQAVPRLRGWFRPRLTAAAVVSLVAFANLPSLWHAALVDPAIDRDENPPAAWTAAAADLDAADLDTADLDAAAAGRVLQVPGIEFGAYRWGITVDQPVAGLTDKPLVTRDLLPLGSNAAMDVVYALDDRIQSGTLDSASIPAAAAVLGVDTVWLTGDLDYPRYQTARPSDLVATLEAVGTATPYGAILTDPPEGATVDETALSRPLPPTAEVSLVALDAPSSTVRSAAGLVAVSGSGDAIVDSTAVHDAIGRFALVYTADRKAPLDGVAGLVITDSNRNRDRHWRSSQDATGATLTADDPVSPLERSQRLSVFANTDPSSQTVAVQDGPITAYAARYGEPFGFQPEHRAAMAVDGSPDTAWTVGEHGDPVGAQLVLTTSVPVGRLEFTQFEPIPGQRRIAHVDVTIDDPAGERQQLGADLSQHDGLDVDAAPGSVITITIESVVGGEPLTEGIVADVGFSEVAVFSDGRPVDPTVEWIRTPVDAVDSMAAVPGLPLAVSLRRDRVASTNPWRSDPEPTLRRIVTVGSDQELTIEPVVRLNPNIADRDLAGLLDLPAWASTVLRGSPHNGGFAAVDGNPATAWITGFGEAENAELHLDAPGVAADRLTIVQPDLVGRITSVELTQGTRSWTLDLDPTSPSADLPLDPPLGDLPFTLRVTGTDGATTVDRRFGDLRSLPVGIAELSVDGRPMSVGGGTAADACVPLLEVDGATLTARVAPPTVSALFPDAAQPLEVTMCDEKVSLDAGEHRVAASPDAPDWFVVDGVEARNDSFAELASPSGTSPRPRIGSVDGDRFSRTISVEDCDQGCWLVFGEGFNTGWRATVDGADLGPPTLLDGTSNGWWLAGDAAVSVDWAPQRALRWAFLASIISVVACFALIVVAARRSPVERSDRPDAVAFEWGPSASTRRVALTAAATVAAAFLVGGLGAMLWSLPVAALVGVTRRPRVAVYGAVGLVGAVMFGVFFSERNTVLLPDATWPDHFRVWHPVGMAAFACLVAFGVFATPSPSHRRR